MTRGESGVVPDAYLMLLPLGFLTGAYGTLIGAGGGFLLVPALLMLYPAESPGALTSISLAAVFFNAFSGAVAYGHMRRIDFNSGLWFALAGMPGAVLGTIVSGRVPRELFNGVFGGVLIALAAFLTYKPRGGEHPHPEHHRGDIHRHLVEAGGREDDYDFNLPLAMSASGVIGFVSSALGIGGGVIQVPVLVRGFGFPPHIATATSQFVLAALSFVAVLSHMQQGAYVDGPWFRRTLCLSMGVLLGAQLGAWLSQRVKTAHVLRLLSIALVGVGLRLLSRALA